MYKKTGAVSEEKIDEILPSRERREEGAYAVFECFEKIPCDPCSTNCNLDAVSPLEDINEVPELTYEKCNGCGLCVSNCPGLACFVVDETYTEDRSTVMIPYEMTPLPEPGQKAAGLNRKGEFVCEVEVIGVRDSENLDNTNVITIAVPDKYVHIIRNIGMGAQ